ncbi:MAG: hypothetical protein RBR45_01835 [Pseudomonas sp.]|jgi:hypothetical protein|nr:hypothetical protein [Pseudomonas sp.]
MDNLKVFKKMGRFITAQINAISHGQNALDRHSHVPMGLESRLIVDAWNTQVEQNGCAAPAVC